MIRRLIILLLIVGCEEVLEPEDCAGVAGGTAVVDDCDVCNGLDGYVAGSCYDCAGAANGTAVEDCLGNCGGEANIDECGVCGGEGAIYECGCSDIPNGDCDCDGNVLGECGVCGGDGSTCIVCADCSDSECCDCDGNVYETVQIGEQLWMAENLKVTHYNDGSKIPYPSDEDWGSNDEGQYAVYDNDPANADIYGNLYNWAVVDDDRGVCPDGFHVPSDDEYTILTDYLGGESVAGGKMKEEGHEHWQYFLDEITEEATNESGFTALPAGAHSEYGDINMGSYGYFWSSSSASYNSNFATQRLLSYLYSNVYKEDGLKHLGFSIRCLKD